MLITTVYIGHNTCVNPIFQRIFPANLSKNIADGDPLVLKHLRVEPSRNLLYHFEVQKENYETNLAFGGINNGNRISEGEYQRRSSSDREWWEQLRTVVCFYFINYIPRTCHFDFQWKNFIICSIILLTLSTLHLFESLLITLQLFLQVNSSVY